MLYIFWFLHQTTTWSWSLCITLCCISFDSYIKPQLWAKALRRAPGCISFDSYIKPQLCFFRLFFFLVVYLLIPTSNHNPISNGTATIMLYIFWFLHQTTTVGYALRLAASCISFDSYIKPQPPAKWIVFLRVVYLLIPTSNHNCILSCVSEYMVVYLLIPTSNHNL